MSFLASFLRKALNDVLTAVVASFLAGLILSLFATLFLNLLNPLLTIYASDVLNQHPVAALAGAAFGIGIGIPYCCKGRLNCFVTTISWLGLVALAVFYLWKATDRSLVGIKVEFATYSAMVSFAGILLLASVVFVVRIVIEDNRDARRAAGTSGSS